MNLIIHLDYSFNYYYYFGHFYLSWSWPGQPTLASSLKLRGPPLWASSVVGSVQRVKSLYFKSVLLDSDPQNTAGTDSQSRQFDWISSETLFPFPPNPRLYCKSPEKEPERGPVEVGSSRFPHPGELDLALLEGPVWVWEGKRSRDPGTQCVLDMGGSPPSNIAFQKPQIVGTLILLSRTTGSPTLVRPHCCSPEVYNSLERRLSP